MKKKIIPRSVIYTLLLGFFMLYPDFVLTVKAIYASTCEPPECGTGYGRRAAAPFNRTFVDTKNYNYNSNNTSLLSTIPISIDEDATENYLAIGTETSIYGVCGRNAFENLRITMDIGIASDEAQAWTLPANLPNLILIAGTSIVIEPDDIPVAEAQYPDANLVTKVPMLNLKGDSLAYYLHLDYSYEDGLDILGRTYTKNNEFDGEFAQETRPFTELPLDFGDEFEDEGLYHRTQEYYPAILEESFSEVDAFGTLHTPFGSFEALVLFSEIDYYTLNSPTDTTFNETQYEISWVTREGFTFTGRIPSKGVEGVVELNQLIMTIAKPHCLENNHITYANLPVQKHQAAKKLSSNGTIYSFGDRISTVFTAGEEITLNAGFNVPAGTTFSASIQGCTETLALVEDALPPAYVITTEEEVNAPPVATGIESNYTSQPSRRYFSSFTASANELAEVELNATLVTEQDDAPLLVERSIDGRKFTKIGTVQGSGNTNNRQHYSFTDMQPKNGVNHYRLRQMNSNSRTGFSKVIQVLVSNGGTAEPVIAIYPNPGKNKVWFSETADYELFDQAGNLLTWGQATGSLDVSQLRKGVYFVKINDGEMLQWVKK